MASSDPYSAMVSSSLEYQSEESRIFRIALILSIVLISGILQWFLLIVVWERCFQDKLRSFADLCSITNVSVFVLAQANFGYYIHGHCPTGRSDVDMGGLELMLATERSGSAPRRGIMADSDRHTYRMALPAALRKAFDRLHAPLLDISTSGPSRGPLDSVHYTTLNDVYQTLNRFLMRFISRDNTEGFRFKIVRKRALEDLLDGEFDDTTLEGLFYTGKPILLCAYICTPTGLVECHFVCTPVFYHKSLSVLS
ncbi:hypothetical protein AHF37_11338 [Paragonimus kellicotti]|nr:hypothetical protein AHF37_11338 [Paragonimus kellicotti]